MVGESVVQVANAIRHTPLPSLVPAGMGPEDPVKGLESPGSPPHVLGGFVGGGQLAWRAVGPTVEIIEPDRGTRKAAWTFGAVLHNSGAQVTSVCGVGKGLMTHVVVGVDLGGDRRPRGLVALLSLHSSRVTRAFHFEHKVTKLCMVSGGELAVDSGTLASELRHWQGLLVVGTTHGTLHLLDLALDLGGHKVLSDEVSPGRLLTMTTPDPDAEHARVSSLLQQCHPTMCLSDGMNCGGRFQLIGPDDSVLFEAPAHQVFVAALVFFPQLASLVVGYSFGAFQIINLSTLTIDCASPYEENMPPVLSFACQEPENDPKNYVYLWLCRSCTSEEVKEGSNNKSKGAPGRAQKTRALCTMYAMNYDNKVWIEGHGLWYQGLASISPRFEFDILGGLGLRGQPVGPSRVFSALTVQLATPPAAAAAATGGPSPVAALTAPDEDSGSVLEQNLCLFGWLGGVMEKGHVSFKHYLAVFDINQWYQAQMPSSLKLDESRLCPYMSFHLLDRVPGVNSDGTLSEVVLGAVPRPASWAQHTSHTCNDSDWFPAALSYDAHVLTSDSLVEYRCQSAQQVALALLTSRGPSAIVSPAAAHAACVFAGLIPADTLLNNAPSSASTMMLEREALLDVALDQQLVSLLVQCVIEFAEGRFSNMGCSLPSLLDWAWAKVAEIKTSSDSLCLPLFDPDCGVVSSDNIAMLHQNLTCLATLTTIISTIRDHAHSNLITLQGAGELEGRVRVVQLVVLYLGAVLWFYHCGLLSPSPIEDPGDECSVPFPAELLSRIYKNRRMEIHNLSASLTGNEILMIDGLLEKATEGSGGSMGKAWQEEEEERGNSNTGGMYPPPSLHALLDMFLLPNVPTTTKHRIVQYLFLDLASLLSDGYVRVVEELVKYPSSFSLSPSLIKLTQAFWLLDHKDFQEGLNVLLDPLVNPCDITPWQHRRIMKAFLYQGEEGRALTYAKMRQPPKVDLDDIRLHLTLLLANGLVREAFHYQRAHRTTANTQDLLQHFFTGCEQQGRLENVIHLPLSPLEEASLVTYLQASASTVAHDYLLVYYLQRARYDDAAVLQDSLRSGLGTMRQRHRARSALVHGYLTHLPDVARRLSSGAVKRPAPAPTIYKKPPPLSAHIRQSAAKIKSHATSLEHQIATTHPNRDAFTPFRSAAQRRRAYELGDLDNYEILVTPKRKELRDASHVVFPTLEDSPMYLLEGEAGAASGLFSPVPPVKRSRLTEPSLLGDSILKAMESVIRRSSIHTTKEPRMSLSQNISADMMSLLETPKVKRRRRPDSRPDPDGTLIDTPQSILKVRQMVHRPLSPSAASDASVPVFPRLSARKAKISVAPPAIVEESSALNHSIDTSLTPKQLRFHLPRVEAREELRTQGKSRLSAGSSQHLDGEEEEEQVGEEEEVEEEDLEEEAVEEEEGCDTAEVEEKVKRVVERTRAISGFVSQRHKTGQGVPTPRQPLHDSTAGLSPTCLSQKSQEIKKLVFKSPSEEKEEESDEPLSREASLSEMFYSFEEEEGAVSARGEDQGRATLEKVIVEEKEEEEVGIEISTEVAETDEDEVDVEDKRNEINCEKEKMSEKEEDISKSISKTDKEVTEHGVSVTHMYIRDREEGEEEEEEESDKEGEKKEEEKPETPYNRVSQRPEKSIISLKDAEDKETDAEAKSKPLPTRQELSSLKREIAVPENEDTPTDLTALMGDEYGLGERGEGAMREDEGFSEEIEPPTETEEGQELEVEVEMSSAGKLVLLNVEKEEHDKLEQRDKLDRSEEEEEESKGNEFFTHKTETTSTIEENAFNLEESVLAREEKQEQQEEDEKESRESVTCMTEITSTREESAFKLEESVSAREEEQECVESRDRESETYTTTETTSTRDENAFNLEECVSTREKEEDMDHCITTQEEEMIAEAISEGEEQLCLNLGSDDEFSPGLSTAEQDKSKESKDKASGDELDMVISNEKVQVRSENRDIDSNERTIETFVVDASESHRSLEEMEFISKTEEETNLIVMEDEAATDECKDITKVEAAGFIMKEDAELHVLASAPLEHTVAGSKEDPELPEEQQPDAPTFVVEGDHGESSGMQEESESLQNRLQTDEAAVSPDNEQMTLNSYAQMGSEKDTATNGVDSQNDGRVKDMPTVDTDFPTSVIENDGASLPEKIKVVKGIQEEESSQSVEKSETSVIAKGVMEVEEESGETVDGKVDQKAEEPAPHVKIVVESGQEPPSPSPEDKVVVEGLSGSSLPPSPSSLPQEGPDLTAPDHIKHRESFLGAGISSDHTEEADHALTPRRSTRHTPTRELATTPLRRSRRLSGASTSSAPATPKRTTRSTTPAREEIDEAPLARVTRSGRKIVQVPTPLTRSKGSPGSPLVTPGKRTRRTSGSQEVDIQKVSQKLDLSPEREADGREEPGTVDAPSVPPTPPVGTPTRRSARKSHVEPLETISEDTEVGRLRSDGRAKTPSRDTTTTPSKATPRRSRRLSTSETLETIAEDAVLSTAEGPLTAATPRRSGRRSLGPHMSVESLTLPQKRRRRTSSESAAEELPQTKSPRRTRRSSGDFKVAPQRTPSRGKVTQPGSPVGDAIHKGSEESYSSFQPEMEGLSAGSRTKRHSLSGDSNREGGRGRLGSLASVAESLSASPARSTPVTSIKDSESSEEEEDQKATKQQQQQQQQAKTEQEEKDGDQKDKCKKIHLLIHSSVGQPIHLNVAEPSRKSIHSTRRMKLSSAFEKSRSHLLDSEKKSTRRVSRTTRKSHAWQEASPSSPLLLQGSGKEEAEVELESSSDKVELEAGLDMDSESVFESSEVGSQPEMELSLLKVGPLDHVRSWRKSGLSSRQGRKKGREKGRTIKLSDIFLNTPEDEEKGRSHLLDKKGTQRGSRNTRKARAFFEDSPSSSPVLLLGSGGKKEDIGMESDSKEAEQDSEDIDDDVFQTVVEAEAQESPRRESSPQGRGRKKGVDKGRGSVLHSGTTQGKEDESNTATTVTRTTRSLRSKQRLASDTTTTTTTQLNLNTRGEERQKVGEEREKPQLSGKEDDQGSTMEGGMKGNKGGSDEERTHREALEGKTGKDPDAKNTPEELAVATATPQFKFAKPKVVSSRREMRALENLTNEAVKFLFSPPLAAGRIAKQQTKAERGSSSSESEAETKSRTTSHKNH